MLSFLIQHDPGLWFSPYQRSLADPLESLLLVFASEYLSLLSRRSSLLSLYVCLGELYWPLLPLDVPRDPLRCFWVFKGDPFPCDPLPFPETLPLLLEALYLGSDRFLPLTSLTAGTGVGKLSVAHAVPEL